MLLMTTATLTEFAPGLAIQGFTAPLPLSKFKLIAFDMATTLIILSCSHHECHHGFSQ